MCFKENYCMIQQGSFALFLARDMLTWKTSQIGIDNEMGLSDWNGKKLKKNQNTKNLICLESLNIFASKTIKELLVLFPSVSFSQEQLRPHSLHSWEVEAMLLKTNQTFYSELGGNQKPHLSLPLSSHLAKRLWFCHCLHRRHPGRGRQSRNWKDKDSSCKVMNWFKQVGLDQQNKILQPHVW